MNVLAIDLGTYSVKFLNAKVTSRKFTIIEHQEVILDKVRAHLPQDLSTQEVQFEIIENYFKKTGFEGKVIYQIPNEFTTSRYLEIPVTNKKKAELMIPFQLDENLPFSSADTHYTKALRKTPTGFNALINITQNEFFEELYNYLDTKSILPALLTSELSILYSYNDINKFSGYSCVLDIGHRTTKAYFFHAGELVSNHISHIAGDLLNNVISKTYQISHEEAIIYKHDNCFFLTDAVYDEVDEDQRNFAILMKQTFDPLISDIKRWDLGYRVKYGHSVDRIYITGGSTGIQNIENFLSQSLSIQIENLHGPTETQLNPEEDKTYNLSAMMARTQQSKAQASNFLFGKFINKFGQSISLHSSAFMLTRVMCLCVIMIAGLVIENQLVLKPQLKKINSSNKKLIKAPALGLTKKEQKMYRRKYEKLLKRIKKKNRIVEEEISTVMSSTGINGLASLSSLSKELTSNKKVDLVSFASSDGKVTAKFSSKESNELAKLSKHLKGAAYSQLQVQYKKGDKNLTVSFLEN